jgi:tRNA pseudouridine55 synthase
MDLILNINKPKGITSYDVIRKLKKIGIKKAGHCGTLDPSAEGVLVICTGRLTKKLKEFQELPKEYIATITFGISTDTGDGEGKIVEKRKVENLKKEDIERVLKNFVGKIKQIPPMFSAVHYKGKKLYELARKGIIVERKEREVEIFKIEILDFKEGENPSVKLKILCSKGTYIRVLAEDIGKSLGYPAYVSELIRTKVGDFSIEEAIKLEKLEGCKNV